MGDAWPVNLRILGPDEARSDGHPLALPGTRQRALLALLLLRGGEPASRAALTEDLFGSQPVKDSSNALQVVVSRLRRALGPEGGRLVSTAAGYAFRVEPGELDLDRFEQRYEEGQAALAAGEPERAAARLRSALEEWRGAAAHATARVPSARWTARVWSGTRLLLAGRLAEAEEEAIRAAELAQAGGFPPSVVRGTLASAMWCIRVVRGGLDELQPVMEGSWG